MLARKNTGFGDALNMKHDGRIDLTGSKCMYFSHLLPSLILFLPSFICLDSHVISDLVVSVAFYLLHQSSLRSGGPCPTSFKQWGRGALGSVREPKKKSLESLKICLSQKIAFGSLPTKKSHDHFFPRKKLKCQSCDFGVQTWRWRLPWGIMFDASWLLGISFWDAT